MFQKHINAPHGAKFRFIFSVDTKQKLSEASKQGIEIYKEDNTLGSQE